MFVISVPHDAIAGHGGWNKERSDMDGCYLVGLEVGVSYESANQLLVLLYLMRIFRQCML
jgi:hypothetical protein